MSIISKENSINDGFFITQTNSHQKVLAVLLEYFDYQEQVQFAVSDQNNSAFKWMGLIYLDTFTSETSQLLVPFQNLTPQHERGLFPDLATSLTGI